MIVIVDRREQDPLSFSGLPYVTEIRGEGLKFGDYGALYKQKMAEWKSPFFFERKSLPDLFGTLTNEERHRRLRERCVEAQEYKAKLIIAIEGTDREVMKGIERSKVNGKTIMKILDTMWLKYDLIPMFCADRMTMAWRMVNLWKTFEERYEPRE